jgi:hypothetical protein
MIKIDQKFLVDLALGDLPVEEANLLLTHVYKTLEMRVGMRLAEAMTNQQLDEYEVFYFNKDDEKAFEWLEREFPTYKEIVQDEFRLLSEELSEMAPTIRSISRKAA